jgi:hypothetical protein
MSIKPGPGRASRGTGEERLVRNWTVTSEAERIGLNTINPATDKRSAM